MADYIDMFSKLAGRVKDAAEAGGVVGVYAKGAERAKAFGQITKLTLDSNRDLEELSRVYAEIGKLYYEQAKDAPEGYFAPLFAQAGELTQGILSKEDEVRALKEQIDAARAEKAAQAEAYDSAEIAAMLRLPKSTVRNRLHDARKLLKERLGADFDEE